MTGEIRLVKGTVQITGDLTPDVVRTLITRHRARTDVEIWRARIADLEFLTELDSLERLALVNCRVDDADALARVPTLRRLFLNQVTPAGGWGFLGAVTQLDELELLNVRGALALPSLAEHHALTRLRLWGCRGFDDAATLAGAPALTELECVDTALAADALAPLVTHPTLRYVNVHLRTAKANAELDEMLAAHGKQRHRPEPRSG